MKSVVRAIVGFIKTPIPEQSWEEQKVDIAVALIFGGMLILIILPFVIKNH